MYSKSEYNLKKNPDTNILKVISLINGQSRHEASGWGGGMGCPPHFLAQQL